MTDSHARSSADICDAAVDRAMTSFQQAVNSMVSCKRCNGTGYHHGFGEHGHDPDWCEVCGGCQSVPEFNDREAMCLAIKAALSGAVAQAVSESIPRASHTARQGGWRLDFDWLVGMQDGIEEATGYNITLECLEEAVVRTEAICTAAQPPAAPVEKRPPGAGPAGATFGGFEPLSPPQSCSAATGDAKSAGDLVLIWQGWANALRLMDSKRSEPQPEAQAQADAYEQCAIELKEALSSVSPQALPQTVLPPREPTEAMLCAARDWSIGKFHRGIGDDAAKGCWQAMFDAVGKEI